jgi:LmbE family N-acetylglucosaminyl deacetylase
VALWACGLGLAGRMWPRQVNWWASDGQAAVLVVAPHPDDETLAAGGVIAMHAQAGDWVTVAVVTDGRRSTAGGLSPEEMSARRAVEVASACQKLGVTDLVCLDLPEDNWSPVEATAGLSPLVAAAGTIYGPSCVDFHPDHLAVARLLASLTRPTQVVRVYEVGTPLSPMLINLLADIEQVDDRKAVALAHYETQAQTLSQAARLARYRAAHYHRRSVEVFWEMSGAAYKRVIAYGRWGWEESPFRGLRSRPLCDPLAFLAGRRTRLTLRSLVQEG